MPPASLTSSTRTWIPEEITGSHWAFLGAVLLVLVPLGFQNYLLFHTLAEVVSIVVAAAAFAVAWCAYPFSRNHFLMYFGIVLFWSGALDLAHALLYKGMNVFPGTGANEPTQVWIATRYFQAAGFLAAPWFLDRPLRRTHAFVFFGAVASAVFVSIMRGVFPDAFIEGTGLTAFKIASEYAVIAMFAGGIGVLWRRRELLDRTVLMIVSGAMGALIAGEFMFTLYVDVYGITNLAGHLFKLAGYWFIYWALVGFTVEQPLRMMARTASTYDAVPEAIVVVDRSGILREANRAAADAMGAEPANCVGRDVHPLLHPADLDRLQCPVCAAIELGRRTTLPEVESKCDWRWYEFTLSPIGRADVPAGMVQVRRDVTERHRVKRILEESERRFRSLTENSTDLIAVLDREGVITYASPSIAHIAGYDSAEIAGRKFLDFLHPEDVPTATREMSSMLQNPGVPIAAELRYRHKTGAWIVLASLSKNLLEDPTVNGIVVNARDVTKRKEAERRLYEQLDELGRFQRVSVGRELRMQELEDEIARLKDKLISGVH
ncbi:MAG: PAS domain S-box protein [Betaproteobacteria bacterium]|nr:PAS domain S-box protein [Betaproteobacteria bacterium]